MKDQIITTYMDETNTRLDAIDERLAGLDEEEFDDLAYRAEAVKLATLRVAVIIDRETPGFVDDVLKVASFLLNEAAPTANVVNYVDQYHYHYNSNNGMYETFTDPAGLQSTLTNDD